MSTVQELKHPRQMLLADQLAALERAAITPHIPGELGACIEEIIHCSLELDPVLTERRERDYVRLLDEMRRLDSELDSHISGLESESAHLSEGLRRLTQDAQTLLANHRRDGRDESHQMAAALCLKQEAVEFVLRCRTHEAALAAWHQEAFMRDRGPVD